MSDTTLPAEDSAQQQNASANPVPEPPSSPAPPNKPYRRWLPCIILFIVLYAGVNIGVYLFTTKGLGAKLAQVFYPATTPTPIPTPTPTPRPIPHGKIGFTVGQSDRTVPQFGKGSIDPYDPAKGTTQTVTVAAKYVQPITKVTATLLTDHSVSTPVSLTLTSGTATNGTWSASWPITDSYLFTYQLTLHAESANTKPADVTITLR